MSRAVRITVGAVVAGTLAFVALVAGVMAATSGAGGGFFDDLAMDSVDTYATAEVLDVDDDWDWPTVDVRWTTEDGEVVVTFVDWEWTDVLPEVGDDVEVVYQAADPEFAYAADDPYVETVLMLDAPVPDDGGSAAADGTDDLTRVAGHVSLAALLGLVITVLITVVAAVRAPAPADVAARSSVLGPYETQGFVGQPYASQGDPAQGPYAPQGPYAHQAGRPPSDGGNGWSSP